MRWMAATVDGRVQGSEAVFEAKFMLPWSFSEEAAVQKYAPQLQHNMWVVTARSAVLSVITGGGKWVEITTHADPLYQHLVVTAERGFGGSTPNRVGGSPFSTQRQNLQLRLGPLMLEMRIAGADENASEFGPGIGGAHIDDADGLNAPNGRGPQTP
jgi:hypothetical protein